MDAVPDPPVAMDDSATTDEGVAVIVGVTANDSDPDGDALTVTAVTQGTNGSVVDNGDGTVTYTPDPGFYGGDLFTYTISDGNGGTDTGTVSVTVNFVDLDGDGMPDSWETLYALDPSDPGDAGMDADLDGLSNLDEFLNGTVPTVADTDGDGASDGDEVAAGTDPLDPADAPPSAGGGGGGCALSGRSGPGPAAALWTLFGCLLGWLQRACLRRRLLWSRRCTHPH